MEFNLGNYKITVAESLQAVNFCVYDKEGLMLDSYSVKKSQLEKAKGFRSVKDIDLQNFKIINTNNNDNNNTKV